MILRYDYLQRYPTVFLKVTGLRLNEFATLAQDVLPAFEQAEAQRRHRERRQRAAGGGDKPNLTGLDQLLLTVVWLRL